MGKRIFKIFFWFMFILVACLILFLTNGFIEKGIVTKKIDDFKARGEFVITKPDRIFSKEVSMHYYKVKAQYDYEMRDIGRVIYDIDDPKQYIGSKTDVILTTRNPMRKSNIELVVSTIGFLSKNFYVGHSTINITDDGSRCIESVGNQSENTVRYCNNDWLLYDDGSPDIIGVRIKDTTEEQRDTMVEYAREQIGKKYNYMFIFSWADIYYCTDLVSRASKAAGININYDHYATTGNDIIMSQTTYIIFYREQIDEENYNIYYLSEE